MALSIAAAFDIRDWPSGCEGGHQSFLLQILRQKYKNKESLKDKVTGQRFKKPNIQIYDIAEGKIYMERSNR